MVLSMKGTHVLMTHRAPDMKRLHYGFIFLYIMVKGRGDMTQGYDLQ